MKYNKKASKSMLSMILVFFMVLSSVLATAWSVNAVNAVVGEKSEYGIVGNMTGWGMYDDFPMYETEEGIFVGSTGMLESGRYEFKVRKDGSWDEVWSAYSEYDDNTKNFGMDISVYLNKDAELLVKLDTTVYEEDLWPVSYAIISKSDTEPDWVYTGRNELIDSEQKFIYKLNEDNTVSIIKFIGNDTNVIIPDTIDEKNVTSISGYRKTINYMNNWYGAFEDCKNLTKVTIPNSVTKIASSAFAGCENLVSITIPDNVTEIGSSAFDGCKSLTNIIIPNKVKEIGGYTFRNCSSLTSITIPDGVTEIGGYSAFEGCESLTNIIIPKNVKEIGGYTFRNCSSLTSITIPDGVTEIGYYVFSGCTGLTSITVPNSVTTIYNSAFEGCESLTNIKIPDNVKEIGKYTFRNCSSLTSITIPDGVTEIGYYVFSGCKGLKSVTIPNSVITIGNSAFEDCSSLTNISIPDRVISIGDSAFENCTGLTSITIPDSVTSIGDSAFEGCTGLTSITIPNSVTEMGSRAFYGCENLQSVLISENIPSWNDNVFYGMWSSFNLFGKKGSYAEKYAQNTEHENFYLIDDNGFAYSENDDGTVWVVGYLGNHENIVIPNKLDGKTVTGIYSMNRSHDKEIEKIKSIVVPKSVTYIGYHAFSSCTGLASIDVDKNNTVYSSDNGVLLNRDKTKVILCPLGKQGRYIIPNGVTEIDFDVFSYCTGITSIVIPDSVTVIDEWAFLHCTGLTSIKVSKDNTVYSSVDGVLFSKDKTSIISFPKGKKGSYTIPNSVTTIGHSAFEGCTNLTSVKIPDSVTTINHSAFADCTNLTSIEIPDSVILVGAKAFDNTVWYSNQPDGLIYVGKVVYKYKGAMPENTSIQLKNDAVSIGYGVFSGCKNLTNIVIPNSVTTIGQLAFSNCTGLTSIDIPNSVTSIDYYAFYDCTALKNIEISDSVISVGGKAFEGTAWYNSQPDGLIYVGKVAYEYKGTMPENTSIELKNGTVAISAWAFFWGCRGLISVEIPNSVREIGFFAFKGCSNLKSVEIPDSVTEIGDCAFGYKFSAGDDMTMIDNFIIYGVSGSAAEIYANKNNMTFVEIQNKILGDTNGDESVDIADALMVARYDAGLIQLDETQLSVSDVNTDDSVDIADALMVARFDAGLIDKL